MPQTPPTEPKSDFAFQKKNHMKRLIILLAALVALSISTVDAKRAAPARVPPVIVGKIEYRAPTSQMGCIEAWDTESNEMIWRRQIYVVKYRIGLERDVQEVFITTIRHKDNNLLVGNESQSEFELDLESLQVKVLKGALVETN